MRQNTSFGKESPLTRELRHQVEALLLRDPRGRFADPQVWMKALFLLALNATLYGAILFLADSSPLRMGLTVLFAVATLFLGLNVMHEAAHGNFSKGERTNRILACTFDLFGISSDLYRIKHIQFHHNYTNLYELDGDINEAPLIRMSPSQALWSIHRFQAFYTPLLYALITLSWPVFDLIRMVDAKVGKMGFRAPPLSVQLRIIAFKCIHYGLALVLPAALLGWKEALSLFLLFHFLLGSILALIFQVAHVHEDGVPDATPLPWDWHLHQIRTSADFSTRNPWVCFAFGGLNFQTIHHLFPNVSYRHYPAIQELLVPLCMKQGVVYREFPSFTAAVVAHFRFLSRMGRKVNP
jgi:linoleoyl-CoA desaturase